MSSYIPVIGLEIHAELLTNSKVFCTCSAEFGGSQNSRCCPVCTGMPGTLPVINEKAVEYAVKAGFALGCDINKFSVFDRKNYFYPDLPKAYQISQLERPLCINGKVKIETSKGEKIIRINRIHLEEDAGKLVHDDFNAVSLADYNRCGVPLIEIVTEPDISSAEEAKAFFEKVSLLLQYAGVCDCKMEQGSLRCDVNVSVMKPEDKEFGTRTECKNLNSLKSITRAIDYEIKRQSRLLDMGYKVVQETRRYNDNRGETTSMRSKEDAHDYRYFPDPDLLPVTITDEEFSRWQQELPELPAARMQRFIAMTGLPEPEAEVLVQSRAMADFFEAAAAKADARKVANFILGPLLRELNARSLHVQDCAMTPEALAELVSIVDKGLISAKIANDIFADLMENGAMPEAYVKEKGLVQISDSSALEAAVDKVLADNPAEVEAFRGGKTKLISFFVGQVMRATRGKANPALVNELLAKKLAG